MANMDEIWELERNFWLGGAEHFERTMADKCLMAFPDPVGILEGSHIVETLKGVPRWVSIEMTGTHVADLGHTVTLAYRAEARREGEQPYRAVCSSTYVEAGGNWRIVQHQQSPI